MRLLGAGQPRRTATSRRVLADPAPRAAAEIPIPLRAPDGDARVDLQDVLHRAYDGPGYEHFIYAGTPDPPLSAEDAAWARQFVP